MYEGRKAQRLRNWKWLSTEKQMVGRKKNLHKVLAFLTGLLCFLVVCWFSTRTPPLGLTEVPALALLSGGMSLSHGLTMMWSLFCFSDPDLLLPLLSGLLYLRFSISIRIFEEDRGAGRLTGGMGHVVTRICSRPCFCALWFLAEGLGGGFKISKLPWTSPSFQHMLCIRW